MDLARIDLIDVSDMIIDQASIRETYSQILTVG